MTPDDERELRHTGTQVVTQHVLIAAGQHQAIHDWAYWQMLRDLDTPRWLAAVMAVAQARRA